jgi:hypothetical protein
VSKRVTVSAECDIPDDHHDGEIETGIVFSFDGRDYEIDLCRYHGTGLQGVMEHMIPWASSRGPVRPRPARPVRRRKYTAGVRAWAKEQGYPLGDVGRIPGYVTEAYERERAKH